MDFHLHWSIKVQATIAMTHFWNQMKFNWFSLGLAWGGQDKRERRKWNQLCERMLNKVDKLILRIVLNQIFSFRANQICSFCVNQIFPFCVNLIFLFCVIITNNNMHIISWYIFRNQKRISGNIQPKPMPELKSQRSKGLPETFVYV